LRNPAALIHAWHQLVGGCLFSRKPDAPARIQQGADLVQRPYLALVAAPADGHRARGRPVEPEDHPHRRRLAGAVRPEEPGDHPGLDLKVDPVNRGLAAVNLRQ
jgi:hypothetical protein